MADSATTNEDRGTITECRNIAEEILTINSIKDMVCFQEKLQDYCFNWGPRGASEVVRCQKLNKPQRQSGLKVLKICLRSFSSEETDLDILKDVPITPLLCVCQFTYNLSKHLQSSFQSDLSKPADILICYLCQTECMIHCQASRACGWWV